MKGESHFDNNVWICKSHYPTMNPPDNPKKPPFKSNKTFIVVRNPYDVIPSYANLVQTFSHSASTGIDYAKNYTEWWHKWVKVITKKIKWFFATLLDEFV